MPRQYAFHTLDVFTERRFGGNPLAVVLGADDLSTSEMQTIAREFNLSETIFVRKPSDPANTAAVRIFLPKSEIPFAGHPTVGCSILLAEQRQKPGCPYETEIRLEAVAGLVPVKVTRIAEISRAVFTAPIIPYAVDRPLPTVQQVADALGLAASDIGFGGHALGNFVSGPQMLCVPVASHAALAKAWPAQPAWSRLSETTGTDLGYLYASGGERSSTSFRVRMFAPASGIPEDPATGAAAVALAGQLLKPLELADGTHRFELEQGHEMGRPSDIAMEADVANGALLRVRVGGSAVPVTAGTLTL